MKIRQRNRTQETQVMQNKISQHLLTNVQPTYQQWSVPSGQVLPVYTLGVISYGVEYNFGQFGSSDLVMFPHSLVDSCASAHRQSMRP